MNGKHKFHKPNGPAFAPGEIWKACSGSGLTCKIVSVRKWGDGKFDYEVTYEYSDGQRSTKDAWPFQVRYYHIADENI